MSILEHHKTFDWFTDESFDQPFHDNNVSFPYEGLSLPPFDQLDFSTSIDGLSGTTQIPPSWAHERGDNSLPLFVPDVSIQYSGATNRVGDVSRSIDRLEEDILESFMGTFDNVDGMNHANSTLFADLTTNSSFDDLSWLRFLDGLDSSSSLLSRTTTSNSSPSQVASFTQNFLFPPPQSATSQSSSRILPLPSFFDSIPSTAQGTYEDPIVIESDYEQPVPLTGYLSNFGATPSHKHPVSIIPNVGLFRGRSIVDRNELRHAFTPRSRSPNPYLRQCLDRVLSAAFYLNGDLEPTSDSSEGLEILSSQDEIFLPDDEMYAYIAAADRCGSIYGVFLDIASRGCKFCGKKKGNVSRALGCVRAHLGHRPFRCAGLAMGCQKCREPRNARFFTQSLLNDHVNGQNKKYPCQICGITLRRGGMKRHYGSKHPNLSSPEED